MVLREEKIRAYNADSEMRDFMQIVYRALMMVARYLEKRYGF